MDGCLWHSIADAFAFSPRPVNWGRTPWDLAKEKYELEAMALLRPAPWRVQVSIRGSRFSNSSCSELIVALFVLSFTVFVSGFVGKRCNLLEVASHRSSENQCLQSVCTAWNLFPSGKHPDAQSEWTIVEAEFGTASHNFPRTLLPQTLLTQNDGTMFC